jgi:hypothetical protein
VIKILKLFLRWRLDVGWIRRGRQKNEEDWEGRKKRTYEEWRGYGRDDRRKKR